MARAFSFSVSLDQSVLAVAGTAYVGLLVALNWPYLSANAYVATHGELPSTCFWALCFQPVAASAAPRIFGFAEFISSLALLVIVFTIADTKYLFRVSIAPIPLLPLTFFVIGLVGVGSLISEVWLAEGWWLPHIPILSRSLWQALFAILFLATFIGWIWYAFVRPPIFNKANAKRYFDSFYRLIVRGAESELAALAVELGRSAEALVGHAPEVPPTGNSKINPLAEIPMEQGYAHDLLLLIANKKFCRTIISVAPTTAIAFFQSASEAEKYHISLGAFGRNISTEAIGDIDSNLHFEDDPYQAGLLGHYRPFGEALYGDYRLVEELGSRVCSPLDVDYEERQNWSTRQWSAYCSGVLITFRAWMRATNGYAHSFALNRAFDNIKVAFHDFYKLNNESTLDITNREEYKRFQVAVKFITDAVELTGATPPSDSWRLRRKRNDFGIDAYDLIVELMYEAISAASKLTAPSFSTWHIQYSATWIKFFKQFGNESQGRKIIQHRLRRVIYDKICELSSYRNYEAAGILGLCLCICGLQAGPNTNRSYRALAKAIVQWTRREYQNIQLRDPEIAAAVVLGSISYDVSSHSLVRTFEKMGPGEPARHVLSLEGVSPIRPARGFRRVKVVGSRRGSTLGR
ncbi:MAG TPA: hypothetical protein VGM81_25800 [Burkholderiaceae bacterium]|jgi:hypothetical protein